MKDNIKPATTAVESNGNVVEVDGQKDDEKKNDDESKNETTETKTGLSVLSVMDGIGMIDLMNVYILFI